jgi:hypothetical protein
VDYLKAHNLASVPALFVICRYLASRRGGETVNDLQQALAPTAVTGRERESAAPGVLKPSLEVGRDLGLIEAEGSRDNRVWAVSEVVATEIREIPPVDSSPFRSLVLKRLGAAAIAAVQADDRPSDVAMALTWLLRQDPLTPMRDVWGDGPEGLVERAGLRREVANAEQWRALLRWAASLGLITRITSGIRNVKEHVLVDPSKAIANMLHELPSVAPANQWFARLTLVVPLFGERRLVAALPTGEDTHDDISGPLALAMEKLERAGRLALVASDDATTGAVVLSLGNRSRRVSQVHVLREGA